MTHVNFSPTPREPQRRHRHTWHEATPVARSTDPRTAQHAGLQSHNQQLSRINAELQQVNRSLRRELESAAAVQHKLLPSIHTTFQGLRFDWLFFPAMFVAGDGLDLFHLGDHKVGFYVLDVAGHGLSAGLRAMWLCQLLHPAQRGRSDIELTRPVETVRTLNQLFGSGDDWAPYFTIVYGVLDTRTRELELVQAGHPNPILLRKGRGSLIGQGGFAIGMLPEAEFSSQHVQLEPGDRLYLYSDGITECRNRTKEPFEERQLMRLFEEQSSNPLEASTKTLWHDLCLWHASRSLDDDVALLALEIL